MVNPGPFRWPSLLEERSMSQLLYRGNPYETRHEVAAKACKVLNYRQQHYNTCREEIAADNHPHLTYRGIEYDKTNEECRLRNDRQSYFKLTRELVQAQFVLADAELARRLWNEVADRHMDVDRITHLMYGCWFQDDDEALTEADEHYLCR